MLKSFLLIVSTKDLVHQNKCLNRHCLPCLLFPRPVVLFVNRVWCLIMIKGMKWWLNTDIKVEGELPSKDKVVIYAIKHQSAWETVFCTDFFWYIVVWCRKYKLS